MAFKLKAMPVNLLSAFLHNFATIINIVVTAYNNTYFLAVFYQWHCSKIYFFTTTTVIQNSQAQNQASVNYLFINMSHLLSPQFYIVKFYSGLR